MRPQLSLALGCVMHSALFITSTTAATRRSAPVRSKHDLQIMRGMEDAFPSVDIPFQQEFEDWESKAGGISFTVGGEPKSGTTWAARLATKLALRLCGNPSNTWCKPGGVRVHPNRPSAWYEYEILNAENGRMYLHFKGSEKHQIPGISLGHGCDRGGREHGGGFETKSPCLSNAPLTRERLSSCLPDTSTPRCIQHLPPLDPDVRRMAIVMRDPREVVLSELRMRTKYAATNSGHLLQLEPFIRSRFETIVAWQHQRWIWHSTALKDVSHLMFYEDLQENHIFLIPLAAFMGLHCSKEDALQIWKEETRSAIYGGHRDAGISAGTLTWMNTTMASLLPAPALKRWGLTPLQ